MVPDPYRPTEEDIDSWDCRWPDPVAIQVAADRLAHERYNETTFNPKISVIVRMEDSGDTSKLISAILITPWAVERIFWNNPAEPLPFIESAYPLSKDESGLIESGQGCLLIDETRKIPVTVAWEPEPGHHFIETLLPSVMAFNTAEEAFNAALNRKAPRIPGQSLSAHLKKPVSRRGLLRFFSDS
ncbi:MAG: hypothetical protein HQL54_08645 [Magnetococcales bacterium]|nr:hypothetical protein [Magnetococcales bacterium]